MYIYKVGVVGAGTMGAQIAQGRLLVVERKRSLAAS
jgi:3-hydroxyacyl-CoA dehydrogenase